MASLPPSEIDTRVERQLRWSMHGLPMARLLEAVLVVAVVAVMLSALTTVQNQEATIAEQAARLQVLVDSDDDRPDNQMAALERVLAETEEHLQAQHQARVQAQARGDITTAAIAQADEQMLLSRLEGLVRQQLHAQQRVVARAAAEQDTESYGMAAAWEARLRHRLQQIQAQRQTVPSQRVSW